MIVILLTTIHILICLFLVIVVLLQSGKAADIAGAFGGMGSQTTFGPRGAATVLSKATTIAAGLFMVTSLSLAIMASRNAGVSATVLDKAKPAQASTPAAPTKAPASPLAPGQPSVTLVPEGGGPTQTIPLTFDEKKGTVSTGTPVPGPPAPAEKAPPAPAKK